MGIGAFDLRLYSIEIDSTSVDDNGNPSSAVFVHLLVQLSLTQKPFLARIFFFLFDYFCSSKF